MRIPPIPLATRSAGSPPAFLRPGPNGWAAGLLLALAVVGCSSTPLQSDKLLLAREAVAHATNMGANEYAPAEMQAARERLQYAQSALHAGNLATANALSDEVLVNTRLAEARQQTAKAEKAATAVRQDSRALQQEIQNNRK